jgi:hypothetical protein
MYVCMHIYMCSGYSIIGGAGVEELGQLTDERVMAAIKMPQYPVHVVPQGGKMPCWKEGAASRV